MTVTIKATTLSEQTDPNAVAGASAGELHELTGKLHETISGYEMRMDAMGAETAADVELALLENKRDVVLKCGSGRRSVVKLPDDADESSVEGELGDGAFVVRCSKKKSE